MEDYGRKVAVVAVMVRFILRLTCRRLPRIGWSSCVTVRFILRLTLISFFDVFIFVRNDYLTLPDL